MTREQIEVCDSSMLAVELLHTLTLDLCRSLSPLEQAVIGPVRLVTAHDGEVRVLPWVSCCGMLSQPNVVLQDVPRAPGMKYTHYAPKAPVKVVRGSVAFWQECVSAAQREGSKVGLLASSELLNGTPWISWVQTAVLT